MCKTLNSTCNWCVPTSWIGLEWVSAQRVRKALKASTTESRVKTILASIVDKFSIAKINEKITCVIQFLERCLHQVSHRDRHATARVKISVWLDCNQSITCCTVIGLSASNKELKRSVHSDFGSAEPSALGFYPCRMHNFKKLSCFFRCKYFFP